MMSAGGFEPRFVPSTAARRFVLIDDDLTLQIPERALRDRADTVRLPPPPRARPWIPALAGLLLLGLGLGTVLAVSLHGV